jgi:CDP-diacylglycerol--glycerol-3-phosphate 3-phosphatidyltransferase/cardiolipin synthase
VTDPAKRICTVANFVSVGRLLLLIPLFYFLREGDKGNGNLWAVAVMAAAMVSDMLDGLLARVLKQVSDWGGVLDPIADKLWICALAAFLAAPWREHPLPWGFLTLILVRDLGIVTCALWAFRRVGVVMTSTWIGKLTMFAEAVTLIAFTINRTPTYLPSVNPYTLMWITVPLIFISGISYGYRFRAVVRHAARHSSLPDPSSHLKVSS